MIIREKDAICRFIFGGSHWGNVVEIGKEWQPHCYYPVYGCEAHLNGIEHYYLNKTNGLYISPPNGCDSIRKNDERYNGNLITQAIWLALDELLIKIYHLKYLIFNLWAPFPKSSKPFKSIEQSPYRKFISYFHRS